MALMGTALVTMLAALAVGVWMWTSTRHEAFQQYTITQVTNTGSARFAAISPDGKFIVYVQRGPDGRACGCETSTRGVTPRSCRRSPCFTGGSRSRPMVTTSMRRSPWGGRDGVFNLQRAPVLGGTPQVLVRNIDSNVTFSPEGDRMAFARGNSPRAAR